MQIRTKVKRSIKADKRKWMANITSEAEDAARKHMKTLYRLKDTVQRKAQTEHSSAGQKR